MIEEIAKVIVEEAKERIDKYKVDPVNALHSTLLEVDLKVGEYIKKWKEIEDG